MNLPGKARVVTAVIAEKVTQRTLYVDSNYPDECASLWESGRYTTLGISGIENPLLRNVEFLRKFPQISEIHINLEKKVDLSPLLVHAKGMKSFFSNDGVNSIEDFRPFISIEHIGQKWTGVMDVELPVLRRLALTHVKDRSITGLPVAERLEELCFYKPQFTSLEGLGKYRKLKILRLDCANKLNNVNELKLISGLRELYVDTCKKMEDFTDVIEFLPEIEIFSYLNSTDFSSISFLRYLKKLRKLIFLDTNVVDGDMRPILNCTKLDYVAFSRKKYFSHSEREIMQLIKGMSVFQG